MKIPSPVLKHINESEYRLTITGLTATTRVLTYRKILANHQHYTKVVTLNCVEGWSVKLLWEGVLVRDLIRESGVDPRANTVVFTAHDTYTTSFPLSYMMNNDILMAYMMNNVTLPSERGYPFELVAEDKWGYKWIKWIEKIELTDNPNYRGYWETAWIFELRQSEWQLLYVLDEKSDFKCPGAAEMLRTQGHIPSNHTIPLQVQ
jgi:DMSO/TMAO reductase YedYZ molybdopterin-dependent catalytic subunit